MTTQALPHFDIGIIGGSGLYQIEGFTQTDTLSLNTPFGNPSDSIVTGELSGIPVAFLPRHGTNHTYLPTEVNYRANIYALKSLGISSLVAVTAVGSLREDMVPLDLVIPDQLIDRTYLRKNSFFGDGVVAHIPFATPFCPWLRKLLYDSSKAVTPNVHDKATLVTIEGPAFSTKAESNLYQTWGCDIIGMTTFQEAKMAREAEICYAALAMVTDYDCWRESAEEEVSVETVISNMKKNSDKAQAILTRLLPEILSAAVTCNCRKSLEGAIMTNLASITQKRYEELELLIKDRVNR